jgi:Mn2+/Fe2+ NRAMP family transporter
MLPMTFVVVYLSAKVGQVSGQGLFRVIKDFYPRFVLYPTLVGAVVAAINLFVPLQFPGSWPLSLW